MGGELLLVVDVQNGFVSEQTSHVIPKIVELISSQRFEDIVFTQFINADSSPYERYLNWFKLKTEDEQALVKEIRGDAKTIFRKTVYTAINSELVSYITNKGISTVYIAGIDTDCCVLTTAVDVFQLGIQPVVLADYCASNGGVESHYAALRVLQRLIGDKQIISGRDI